MYKSKEQKKTGAKNYRFTKPKTMRLLLFFTLLLMLTEMQSQVIPNRDLIEIPPLSLYVPPSKKSACSEEKMREIRAQATPDKDAVIIDCSCTFTVGDVVTKRLIFEGSGSSNVVITGNGAKVDGNQPGLTMMEIVSKEREDGKWDVPQNITMKNLFIKGRVNISGMGGNTFLKRASQEEGYVERARRNAPHNIQFDKIIIEATGKIPLYLLPGVNNVELSNSELKGSSNSVAIYLDAESCCNTFRNNYIHVETSREVIAIDASENNRFINNRFSGLNHGGIYLYRNCGERGVVRHTTPNHNQIINNSFYYNNYTGPKPSVYLGSRNGGDAGAGYCDEDGGFDFGSSKSDLDYARYNVVMQNQIYKRNISDMIIGRNPKLNSPNFINYNTTVTTAVERRAGCYISANGYQKDFILHGDSAEVMRFENGMPVSYYYLCYDGELTKRSKSNKVITAYVFDCAVTGNNNGCRKVIQCPSGKVIFGARAAANLEQGSVTDEVLMNVGNNTIEVVKTSDNESEGVCFMGRYETSNKISYRLKPLEGFDGDRWVLIGCKEHDTNGGDCHIRAILYCR